MANVYQAAPIVNDVVAELYGAKTASQIQTDGFVSLGKMVLSSTDNVDAFYSKIYDRIALTVFSVRPFEVQKRSVRRNDIEWGAIVQKIIVKTGEAVDNPSWVSSTQANPFDVEIKDEVVVKMFKKIATYTYEDSIPRTQLFTAFTSESAMDSFVSSIYVNMANELEMAAAGLDNLAVATNMAYVLKNGKSAQKRNLLSEYCTLKGIDITTLADINVAFQNADFLKYCAVEIGKTVKNIQSPSTIFNVDGIKRQTRGDNLVVEVNSGYIAATEAYLEADTYHNELVKLPNYEEIPYWQYSGESFSLDDTTEINVKYADDDDSDNSFEVQVAGILAFVHDRESCASIITNRRTSTIYNPRAERLNVFEKADKGYAVDGSENAVVFYAAAYENIN